MILQHELFLDDGVLDDQHLAKSDVVALKYLAQEERAMFVFDALPVRLKEFLSLSLVIRMPFYGFLSAC